MALDTPATSAGKALGQPPSIVNRDSIWPTAKESGVAWNALEAPGNALGNTLGNTLGNALGNTQGNAPRSARGTTLGKVLGNTLGNTLVPQSGTPKGAFQP